MSGLVFHIEKRLGDLGLDVSVNSAAGVTALFGPSGAGKTTVVRMLAGLERPERGRIELAGEVVFDAERGIDLAPARRRVGVVFQDARLFPHMNVEANLRYGGGHDSARVIEMLGLGGLLKRAPNTLSGGEMQRVALGRALMSDPRALLLDEPLAALDAARKGEIMPYLERLRDEIDLPILYVSHALDEVARLASDLVLLREGRVEMAGPIGQVLGDARSADLLGAGQAGGLLHGVIVSYDAAAGLTRVALGHGSMLLPGDMGEAGQTLRLLVRAHEVILSQTRPEGLSALNILEVTVRGLTPSGAGGVIVSLSHGVDPLLARITEHSAKALGLMEGASLFAIIKATALTSRWG